MAASGFLAYKAARQTRGSFIGMSIFGPSVISQQRDNTVAFGAMRGHRRSHPHRTGFRAHGQSNDMVSWVTRSPCWHKARRPLRLPISAEIFNPAARATAFLFAPVLRPEKAKIANNRVVFRTTNLEKSVIKLLHFGTSVRALNRWVMPQPSAL